MASLATEMIRGKTAEEVLAMSAEELAPGLGPLPPVKIHCTQLVESALALRLARLIGPGRAAAARRLQACSNTSASRPSPPAN